MHYDCEARTTRAVTAAAAAAADPATIATTTEDEYDTTTEALTRAVECYRSAESQVGGVGGYRTDHRDFNPSSHTATHTSQHSPSSRLRGPRPPASKPRAPLPVERVQKVFVWGGGGGGQRTERSEGMILIFDGRASKDICQHANAFMHIHTHVFMQASRHVYACLRLCVHGRLSAFLSTSDAKCLPLFAAMPTADLLDSILNARITGHECRFRNADTYKSIHVCKLT